LGDAARLSSQSWRAKGAARGHPQKIYCDM
jgi:hypothetical protein